MNIAVFHNLPSGGAKRALYNSVRHLRSAGHQIDAHVPSTADESYLPLKDVVNGFYSYAVHCTFREAHPAYARFVLPTKFTGLERAQKAAAERINSGDYDVVLTEQDVSVMTPFVLRWLTKPTVYYCQQPSRVNEAVLQQIVRAAFPEAPVPWFKRVWRNYLGLLQANLPEIDKKNASYAKNILANSCFSRESILRSYGLNSLVCYLGVDTDFFRPIGNLRDNFILTVGECSPHKGFDFAIRAVGRIASAKRPKLVIVSNSGGQAWENYLTRLAASVSVNLEIKRRVPDTEMLALYNSARAFVYSAFLEPFGLAPLEAMACGTPVVAVREGGVRESVADRETGILAPRDESAFAEAVTELLDDARMAEAMGRRGVEAVRNFWTLAHAGERLEGHLLRVAGQRAGVGGSAPFQMRIA